MKNVFKSLFLVAFIFSLQGLAASWSKDDFSDINGKDKPLNVLIIGANGSVAREVTQGF